MIIKINKKPYSITPLSELTFDSFNRIYVRGEVDSLPKYLALFCDIDYAEFISSKFEYNNIDMLAGMVFDIDVEKVMKTKKNTIKYKEEFRTMDSLAIDTFGRSFILSMYVQEYKQENINFYELAIRALSVALVDDDKVTNTDEVDKVYNRLSGRKWMEVLPQGFFLLKLIWTSKINFLMQSLRCTMVLRMTHLRIRSSIKRAKSSEKK